MQKACGFTLAEVLITLAIIGVVAALTIPSVIANTQQQEFKTGLKKAVSVLNSAITMNMAIDGESPYENKDLYNYLQRHMSVSKRVYTLPWYSSYSDGNGNQYKGALNGAFYTTDGMRYEFDDAKATDQKTNTLKLHESDHHACFAPIHLAYTEESGREYVDCGGCGSLGLAQNPNNTTKVPCAILVDVNGDRKPTPQKVGANAEERSKIGDQKYWIPNPASKRISDIFIILITDNKAIPYGVTAQKAMYEAQK